jgi:hypothetical protein
MESALVANLAIQVRTTRNITTNHCTPVQTSARRKILMDGGCAFAFAGGMIDDVQTPDALASR